MFLLFHRASLCSLFSFVPAPSPATYDSHSYESLQNSNIRFEERIRNCCLALLRQRLYLEISYFGRNNTTLALFPVNISCNLNLDSLLKYLKMAFLDFFLVNHMTPIVFLSVAMVTERVVTINGGPLSGPLRSFYS